MSALYKRPYNRISACSRFIENIDRLGASREVIWMKAEARFIHACSYFYLASYFHDVPLVKTVLTAEESNNVKKAARAEVIQYIVDELTEISTQLPRHKELPATELERATSQAALVFLARTHLLNKEYKKAAEVCNTIITWGDNQLHDNYQTLFYPAGKSSPEHIFAIHLVDNLAGHALPQHAYPVKDAGWCLVNGSSHLYEAYEFLDGSPFSYEDPRFNPDNLGENRDPRLDYTLIYNRATFRGTTYTCHPESGSVDKIGAGQASQTGYLLRKYFDET
ncbi:MAG: RagB/SusD family nutrient uptake outer membrane protein [Tannerellaceae bacterium]|nr:RagB/SusD family nutrient uptake outer membrane protein [Tannerellaceae bacterium]MCD8263585.1 RagB/SusD family nutrient uptake outer membrane protein [Tannerellaceae bacterium]